MACRIKQESNGAIGCANVSLSRCDNEIDVVEARVWHDKISTSFAESAVTRLAIDRHGKTPLENYDYTVVRKATYFILPMIFTLMAYGWKKAFLVGAPIAELIGYTTFLILMLLRDAFLYSLYYKNIDIAGYEFLTRYICVAAHYAITLLVYNKFFLKESYRS